MSVQQMLNDGFSHRQANYLSRLFDDETSYDYYDQDYVKWAHSYGFSAESAYAYRLNTDNIKYYLSDYQYYRLWPINNWTRIWINDKLTLKQILSGTKFDSFMPKYFFYTIKSGEKVILRKLVDCPEKIEQNSQGLLRLLQEETVLACKPCNGALSMGFNKLSYENDKYYINEEKVSKTDMITFISEHPNYLFTEYLTPSKSMKKIFPTIHTLRIVVVNENGYDPIIIGGYMRIPHKTSSISNYIVVNGNLHDEYNLQVDVNMDSGEFGNGKITFSNRIENVSVHPETKALLSGRIEQFDKLKSSILSISKILSPLEFMGFDIGITPNGFKCMEINSLPGIKYMQIFHPFFANPVTETYFNKKIQAMDNLSETEKKERNGIIR